MGKASKWFRKLLGHTKAGHSATTSPCCSFTTSRRRWSFVKSYREGEFHAHQFLYGAPSTEELEAMDRRAIAVANASTACAEAAVAAAEAAAAVVRMRWGMRCEREEWGAVKIQAAFRGCLARRALRALKGLVRLQALVRGNIERKRTAECLQKMQTLMRAQQRARIARARSPQLSRSNTISPTTPEKFEDSTVRTKSKIVDQTVKLKRNGSISKTRAIGNQERTKFPTNPPSNELPYLDNERSGKVFDIHVEKTQYLQTQKNPLHLTPNALVFDQNHQYNMISKESTVSPSRDDSRRFEEGSYCAADDSSRRSPFTPTKSEGSRSCFVGYSECPNYMASTESSKARMRSLSAPRMRPRCEMSGSVQRVSALHASFVAKAYPGSGRFDNLGMPVSYKYADCI